MKKLISIIISAHNEESGLRELARRLKLMMAKLPMYDFEVILVEHGSTDNSFEVMSEINSEDPRFKIIQLSKNFGYCDNGYTAGIHYASGDAAVIMNADLQDPPEVIPKFIAKWEEGYDIVYGIITKREGVSLIRKIVSPIFYQIINKLSNNQIPRNATDFRLIDKKVYESLNKMPEHNRFLRGMVVWTGFRQTGIGFARAPRFARGGEGTGAKNVNPFRFLTSTSAFTVNAVVSFSTFPLRLVTLTGLFVSLCSFGLAAYFIIYYLIYGTTSPGYVRGYSSTLVIITLLFGMLFVFLGIIGEYISRIYDEVKQRPNFIVRQTIGFGREKQGNASQD